jgi:hypothetical protein
MKKVIIMFLKKESIRKPSMLIGLLFLCCATALGLNPAQGQEIKIPGITERRPVGIHQVFDYGFDMPLDSCKGGPFLIKVIFDPLPELNKPTHVRVKLKACFSSEREVRAFVQGDAASMLCNQTEPTILTSEMSEGEIYEWDLIILPRDIGRYILPFNIKGVQLSFFFGFNESGELVYLDKLEDPDFKALPNHPAVNGKDIIIHGKNTYFKNIFRIVPPPFLNDTSLVYYKLTALSNFPRGVKIMSPPTRLWKGPVKSGDVCEGSFTFVPKTTGRHTTILSMRDAAHPLEPGPERHAIFNIFYILDEEGELKFIAGYELHDESVLDEYK